MDFYRNWTFCHGKLHSHFWTYKTEIFWIFFQYPTCCVHKHFCHFKNWNVPSFFFTGHVLVHPQTFLLFLNTTSTNYYNSKHVIQKKMLGYILHTTDVATRLLKFLNPTKVQTVIQCLGSCLQYRLYIYVYKKKSFGTFQRHFFPGCNVWNRKHWKNTC